MARRPDGVPDDDRMLSTAISAEDKQHCLNLVIHGISYLQGQGWRSRVIAEFLERVDVQKELARLKEQYEDRSSIQERVQFFTTLQVNKMVPTALNVLARTLQGDVMNEDGTVKSAAPARAQYQAAIEVLNRANIHGDEYGGRDNLPALDQRAIEAGARKESAGDKWNAQTRDKVRKLLGKVMRRVDALDAAEQAATDRQAREAKPVDSEVVEDDDG